MTHTSDAAAKIGTSYGFSSGCTTTVNRSHTHFFASIEQTMRYQEKKNQKRYALRYHETRNELV